MMVLQPELRLENLFAVTPKKLAVWMKVQGSGPRFFDGLAENLESGFIDLKF